MTDQLRHAITNAHRLASTALAALDSRGAIVDERARALVEYLDTAVQQLTASAASIAIQITPNDKGNPPGKLADAELHFLTGPLSGSKLIGFSIWERRTGGGRNVTFPARQYSVNGERRSFALLRPVTDSEAQDRVREMILDSYRRHEETADAGHVTKWPYDEQGHSLNQQTSEPNVSETPSAATRSTETTDQDLKTSGASLSGACEAITANPELNPGIILGSMIVQAVYGTPGPIMDVRPAAPKARRF